MEAGRAVLGLGWIPFCSALRCGGFNAPLGSSVLTGAPVCLSGFAPWMCSGHAGGSYDLMSDSRTWAAVILEPVPIWARTQLESRWHRRNSAAIGLLHKNSAP